MWVYLVFGVFSFLLTGSQGEVTEVFAAFGSEAILPCECSPPSKSAPSVLWRKADRGTVLRRERSGLLFWGSSWKPRGSPRVRCPPGEFTKGEHNLHIGDVREEDAGLYTCSVEDTTRSVKKSVMLRVITVSISPSLQVPGSDVHIKCNVIPWSSQATVLWELNQKPFVPEPGMKAVADVVQGKVTPSLAGNWTCLVSRGGTTGRGTAALSVRGIEHPPADGARIYAATGSSLSLPCVFSSDLTISEPLWERLNPALDSASSPLPPSFASHPPSRLCPWDLSANLTRVGPEDAGRYRCSATAAGQRLSRTLQLVVAKIVVGYTPSNKASPATLTCDLSDPEGVTEYEWVHVTHNANGSQAARSVQRGAEPLLVLTPQNGHSEWVCRFYGANGILGNVSSALPVTGGRTGDASSTPSRKTAMVVGLGFLLLVLLLVLAQMYRNHQMRRSIFQYPALESIVHTHFNEREARGRAQEKG